jgi:UDPglucose 6-dehydrogenase
MAQIKGRHPQLLRAVMEINEDRIERIVERVQEVLGDLRGKTLGILGLAFKPNTDDMREAPSIRIAARLQEFGALVRAYDPVAMENAARVMPGVQMASDPYGLAERCDALLVCTEWNEFRQLDFERLRELMRRPILVDGRNLYDPAEMRALGFHYRGLGRGSDGPLDGSPQTTPRSALERGI